MQSRNEECLRLAEHHEQERRFCKETIERFRTSDYPGRSPLDEAEWASEMMRLILFWNRSTCSIVRCSSRDFVSLTRGRLHYPRERQVPMR
jgi:hypothetical protein